VWDSSGKMLNIFGGKNIQCAQRYVSSPQQHKINITWKIGKTGKGVTKILEGSSQTRDISSQEKISSLIIFNNKGIKSLNLTEFSFNFIILSFNTIK